MTKVEILSGEQTLMNLEVRIGMSDMNNEDMRGVDGKKRITGNELCGIFYGPTLVAGQWVEVDCGRSRGLKGKRMTLQLPERFEGNNPLQISSLEVFGWGRVCGEADPSI